MACATPFSITQVIVPEYVPPGQTVVDIECLSDSNFTTLIWFKGRQEFFKYIASTTIRMCSNIISGIGTVQPLACGPTTCKIRLGQLTDAATGLYTCEIERDVPTYRFDTRTAAMTVQPQNNKTPILEGLAEEYGEDDTIEAFCRAKPETEIRWYVNDHEIKELRGSSTFNRKSTRNMFVGLPPRVKVQCAEYLYGRIRGSKEIEAKLKEAKHIQNYATEFAMSGSSDMLYLCKFCLLSICLCLLKF